MPVMGLLTRTEVLSVMKDRYSGTVSMAPLHTKADADTHLDVWKQKYGQIETVCTDNGGEFIGSRYREKCRQLGITRKLGAPYTPQSQGGVERMNQEVKKIAAKFLWEWKLPQSFWDCCLGGIRDAIDLRVHSRTGKTPYEMRTGQAPDYQHWLLMGDIVVVTDPTPQKKELMPKGRLALVLGRWDSNVVSVALRDGKRWTHRRLHPSHLKSVPLKEQSAMGSRLLEGMKDGDWIDLTEKTARDGWAPVVNPVRASDQQPMKPQGKIEDPPVLPDVNDLKKEQGCSGVDEGDDGEFQDPLPFPKHETDENDSEADFEDADSEAEDLAWTGGAPTKFEHKSDSEVSDDEPPEMVSDHSDSEDEAPPTRRYNLRNRRPIQYQDRDKALDTAIKGGKGTPKRGRPLQHARRTETVRVGDEGVEAADLKEFGRWLDTNSVTDEREGETPDNVVPTRVLRDRRRKGGELRAKTRLVVQGHRDKSKTESRSGTPSFALIFFSFLIALTLGFKAAVTDVSTAFLHAPMKGNKYIRLPMDIPEYVQEKFPFFVPGKVVRALTALYGFRESPKLYTDWFKTQTFKLGYQEVAECILVKKDEKGGILSIYV